MKPEQMLKIILQIKADLLALESVLSQDVEVKPVGKLTFFPLGDEEGDRDNSKKS